jgi:ribonuclease D
MSLYPPNISKDEIKELPIGKFEGDIHVVTKMGELHSAIRTLKKSDTLGFDTEKKPTFKKGQYHPPALIQLSTLDEAFLFRINHIGFHHTLVELFEDQSIAKIGVSIRDDLIELNKVYSFQPAGFVELNDVVSDLGITQNGVRNLAAILLEIRISKNQQVSNWESDTLSEAQLIYAATDAWVCLRMYDELNQKGYINGAL